MRYLYTSAAMAALMVPMLFARAESATKNTEADTPTETKAPETPVTESAEAKTSKSIVPSKYAGRYKDGGSDELSEFIKKNCVGKDGFEFPSFFLLCRKNGLDEAKVADYEAKVADKANHHGIEGRARMTLRNMLATPARKNGKLIGIDDVEYPINIAKPALTGAAATAQAAKTEEVSSPSAPEVENTTDGGGAESGAEA